MRHDAGESRLTLVFEASFLPQQLLRYILGADIDKDAFETKLRQIQEPETRADAMTLAQQYHNEGLQKGRQEGSLKRQKEDVIEALEIRFERVPEGLAEAVRDIRDEEHLSRLLRSAIRCATVEEFAASL